MMNLKNKIEWVKVEERLPMDLTPVLVWDTEFFDYSIGVSEIQILEDGYMWIYDGVAPTFLNPTHWATMPSGPIPMKTILFRPVGPKELELIKNSGWRSFPPRQDQQPIFYPVMNQQYAEQIAKKWNVEESGSGFVTMFEVDSNYLGKFEIKNVGGPIHNELWVPAEELDNFNSHIVGVIEVIKEFHKE